MSKFKILNCDWSVDNNSKFSLVENDNSFLSDQETSVWVQPHIAPDTFKVSTSFAAWSLAVSSLCSCSNHVVVVIKTDAITSGTSDNQMWTRFQTFGSMFSKFVHDKLSKKIQVWNFMTSCSSHETPSLNSCNTYAPVEYWPPLLFALEIQKLLWIFKVYSVS